MENRDARRVLRGALRIHPAANQLQGAQRVLQRLRVAGCNRLCETQPRGPAFLIPP